MQSNIASELVKIDPNYHELHGFGMWKIQQNIGQVGLNIPLFEADFTPIIQIGWFIEKEYRNCGFASKYAKIILKYYEDIGPVAIIQKANLASKRVAEKIGMKYTRDFIHPIIDEEYELWEN